MYREFKYKVNDKLCLLKEESGIYHILITDINTIHLLNYVAFFILQNAAGQTKQEIINNVVRKYKNDQVKEAQLYEDCSHCIDKLSLDGLLIKDMEEE